MNSAVRRGLSRCTTTEGDLLGEVMGPVWAQYPQTPQAGEYFARGMAGNMAKYPSTLYSDCLNVVKHSKLPPVERLSGKRAYSGIIMEANAREGTCISDIVKVAAHKDIDEAGIDQFEHFCRKCNNDADAAARAALSFHATDVNGSEDLSKRIDIAKAVCRLGGQASFRVAPS